MPALLRQRRLSMGCERRGILERAGPFFSRGTENGPAFCECFVCANKCKASGPLSGAARGEGRTSSFGTSWPSTSSIARQSP